MEIKLTLFEIITLFKDVLLTCVGVTGAIVAVKGLGTWQRQLKGQSEYELSRRLLVTLFKYRDSIDCVRHPAIWAYEMPSPPEEEAEKMSKAQIRFYGTSNAYQARWNKVNAERTTLYTDLLFAEAIWGQQVKQLFKKLFDLEHELYTQIRQYLEIINPDTSDVYRHALEKIYHVKREIIYDMSIDSEDNDDFKNDMLTAIEKIEEYLKPKLIH